LTRFSAGRDRAAFASAGSKTAEFAMSTDQQPKPHGLKAQGRPPYLSTLLGVAVGAAAGWVSAWPSEFGVAVFVPLGAFAGACIAWTRATRHHKHSL
jgi:hypothetical protein